MSHKPLLERMDDAVRWTGIPALAGKAPRRRPLRWPSTIALLLAIAGFALALFRPDLWLVGYAPLVLSLAIAGFMPILGPLKPWNGLELVDERDRTEQAKAYLAALGMVAFAAVIAILMIVGLSLVSNWPIWTMRLLLIDLLMLIITIFLAGPTCFASWAEQPLDDDEA